MSTRRDEKEVREQLKKIRKEKGLTGGELAKMMSYAHASRVSEFEKGKTKNIDEYVHIFCKIMNINEQKILFYEESDTASQIKAESKHLHIYKVPSLKLSLVISIIIFIALSFHVISSIIINEALKMCNIAISTLAFVCGVVFLLIQALSSENDVEVDVEDRSSIAYQSSENTSKHPLLMFILTQVLIIITLTIVLSLVCVNYPDPLFVAIYIVIVLLEIFHLCFGINVHKKESKKKGLIIYIFEFITLLIYLFFSTVITVGIQTGDTNPLSYICLFFSETTLLLMILRLLDCNSFLKHRKIISEKQKK